MSSLRRTKTGSAPSEWSVFSRTCLWPSNAAARLLSDQLRAKAQTLPAMSLFRPRRKSSWNDHLYSVRPVSGAIELTAFPCGSIVVFRYNTLPSIPFLIELLPRDLTTQSIGIWCRLQLSCTCTSLGDSNITPSKCTLFARALLRHKSLHQLSMSFPH